MLGLHPEVGVLVSGFGPQDVPHFFVEIRVLVLYVTVQEGYQGDFTFVVHRCHTVLYQTKILVCQAVDMLYVYFQCVAFGRGHPKVTVRDSLAHVESSSVCFYIPMGQVQFLIDQSQVNAAPVRCVGDAREETGIAVFPPSHPGSVEKGDAHHVRALQAVTAIGFFKISPLSEPAVSEAEYAFRSAHVIGVKTLFYDVPFVYLEELFHGFLRLSRLFTAPKIQKKSVPTVDNR